MQNGMTQDDIEYCDLEVVSCFKEVHKSPNEDNNFCDNNALRCHTYACELVDEMYFKVLGSCLEGMQVDMQPPTPTNEWKGYNDEMEKELASIFVKHADFCEIEVQRYLKEDLMVEKKCEENMAYMHTTCDEDPLHHGICSQEGPVEEDLMYLLDESLDGFHSTYNKGFERYQSCHELGQQEHEDMELMALSDNALEEFQAPYDRGFEKYNEICDLQQEEGFMR
ncbi:hypothetical protein GOP47_0016250 [Adiantum capillus-veneris]|uniref:Uncharacterized protein n=1 Tax=Adiantum capillus-veneris TaxID=13818 RepID=A0A9D4UHH2_ADICA|nr:hypothetical protein GOP47_0016250 [Adiantum capillus-veneris]